MFAWVVPVAITLPTVNRSVTCACAGVVATAMRMESAARPVTAFATRRIDSIRLSPLQKIRLMLNPGLAKGYVVPTSCQELFSNRGPEGSFPDRRGPLGEEVIRQVEHVLRVDLVVPVHIGGPERSLPLVEEERLQVLDVFLVDHTVRVHVAR